MIIVADSGSTKTDWVVLDGEYKEAFRARTIGLNPYFVTSEDIFNALDKSEQLGEIVEKVTHVYFYGAGCSSEFLNAIVEKGLTAYFTNAEIVVDHDLLAACYAVYRGKPTITCILGTGSNSCYFDGKELTEETPSLAYILGDEGSGNSMGKKVLQGYFLKKMPENLVKAFDEEFGLTVEELNKNVYMNKFANTYLASFSKFIASHLDEPFIQNIIYQSMEEFFVNQILPYPQARSSEINFIGSIAFYYQEIIRAVASKYHYKVGHIVQRPIDNLVQYHRDYILS